MNSKDWVDTLSAVAPALASALGGPLAGLAVGMATKALGNTEGSESELAAAIATGDPDVLVKLKEANHQFELELKRLDVELEKVNAGDRDSARTLAINQGLKPQLVLSTIYTVGFVWLLWALFAGQAEVPKEHLGLANVLIGMLGAGQTQILNFFFGSSSGSKEKTLKLAER